MTAARTEQSGAAADGSACNFRRAYSDALSRPLSGTVTFRGTMRRDSADRSVLPATVSVPLVEGILDVSLPPDTYLVTEKLMTVEQVRITSAPYEIVLEAS